MPELTPDEIASIAAAELLQSDEFEPKRSPATPKPSAGWYPELNRPTQAEIFEDPTPFILAYGEKGSGKSIGMEHKLVRHLYENWDALALIVTPSIRTGKFGVIHDLESLILPAWTDGIGLDWIPSKLDPNTKDRILKVGNRFGGWSTAIQIAIPYEEAIPARIKGIHPSMAFVDELTDCEGVGYFNLISAQLNRRRNITGPQQYVATCNPKGPSNWVYKKFFEDPVNLETGEVDRKFKVYHVPFRENAHRPEMRSYIETLESAVKSDPIERARLIEGKWVERPTGDSLFASHFNIAKHLIGNKALGTGICPVPGLPCAVGYDIGQVYNAAVFLQRIPFNGRMVWIVFDEVVHLKEKILYKNMAEEIVEKILMWNDHLKTKLPWEHITDDSAVNQWRPNASGSYDKWDFEKEFNAASIIHGLPQMKMRGVQKGAGSVETRVRLTQGYLINDELYVSANCPFVIDMLMLIDAKKDEELIPRKTVAGHIHVFDALSYPMLHWNFKGPSITTGPIASSFTMIR